MKRGTIEHPKIMRLARALGCPKLLAVGIMEATWHFAARYAPRGDLGRFTDEEIADAIEYAGDPSQLVAAMTESGWLDANDAHRLVLHHWNEHADDAVHMTLARNVETFACGAPPRMTRLSTREREEIEARFRAHKKRTRSARNAHTVRTAKPSHAKPSQASTESEDDTRTKPFEAFWNAYPKKVGKGAAAKAWEKAADAKSLPDLSAVLAAVTRARGSAQWQRDGGQYIPNPATWLNQERWSDQPVEVVAPSGPVPTAHVWSCHCGQTHMTKGPPGACPDEPEAAHA